MITGWTLLEILLPSCASPNDGSQSPLTYRTKTILDTKRQDALCEAIEVLGVGIGGSSRLFLPHAPSEHRRRPGTGSADLRVRLLGNDDPSSREQMMNRERAGTLHTSRPSTKNNQKLVSHAPLLLPHHLCPSSETGGETNFGVVCHKLEARAPKLNVDDVTAPVA